MSLGTELSADGSEVFLRTFAMPIISSNAFVLETASDASELSQVAGPDLSTEFETNGSITIVFGSTTVVVSGGTGDTSEPYNIPSSLYPGALNLLASAHSTASDKAITVTFDDGAAAALEEQVQAAVTSGAPTLTAAVQTSSAPVGEVVTLDAFDQTRHDVIVLAVLEANPAGNNLTLDNVTPIEGEMDVSDALTIRRVQRWESGDRIRLRRIGGAFDTYFDDEGTPRYPTARLYIGLDNGGTFTTIAYTIGAAGSAFANFNIETASQASLVNGLTAGTRFLLAITRAQAIQTGFESGVPAVTAAIQTALALQAQVQASVESGAPTLTAQVRTTPPPSRVRGAVEAGTPTLTARVSTEAPGETQVGAAIESGAPTVAARVRATRMVRVQGDLESGTAAITARVRTEAQGETRPQGAIESGTPTLTAQVRTTPAPARIRADVESGTPSLTASVKTTPPPARVRADVESGTPSLTAAARTTPAPARVRADVDSGAPHAHGKR